ncbi:prophage regulatory protein [Halomonas ventosae]|uniref:Prophage regulatory protein n=2 Tax=Halomonas ventosae TaxID=229007 RepID=A0A2T0VL69_9GAMM|nr:prophage regulatory protein [Halomonas ventosae]
MVGLSIPTIYRQMKQGTFPKSVKLTPNGRAVGWYRSEVEDWQASRRQTDKGAA